MIHLKAFAFSIGNSAKSIQRSMFSYSFNHKRNADTVLKDYFSLRLGISTSQLQDYVIQLSKCEHFNKKDDRWGNLCLTIQRNLLSFDLKSKIAILKSLAKVKQSNQLFVCLLKQIIANIDFLTLEELSKVAWSLVRTQSLQKTTILLIYKRIIYFLNKDKQIQKIGLVQQNEQQQKVLKTNIIITKKELSIVEKDQLLKQNSSLINISGKNYILLIWSLMKSKMIDKKILMKLTKIATKQENILNIQIEDQCLLLHCLTNLQMQKIRATRHLTQNIILKHKQVQELSMLSLVLLLQSFSHFIFHRQTMILDNDNENQVRSLQTQIQKNRLFLFFILETIILRHKKKQRISHKFSSIIIFHLAKINLYDSDLWKRLFDDFTNNIDQATVQDLTMAIQGIAKLQKPIRDQIKIYQQNICKRIWQIYNSIHGKSLDIIEQLIKRKQIFPPPRIVKEIRRQSQYQKHELNKEKYKNQKKNQQILSTGEQQELKSSKSNQSNELLKKRKSEKPYKQKQHIQQQLNTFQNSQNQNVPTFKKQQNHPINKGFKKYTKVQKN